MFTDICTLKVLSTSKGWELEIVTYAFKGCPSRFVVVCDRVENCHTLRDTLYKPVAYKVNMD